MKKWFLLLFLLPVLMPLVGIPYPVPQEIERFEVGDLLTVDETAAGLELTMTVRSTKEGTEAVYKAAGKDEEEALANLKAAAPKEILYAHTRFVIFGEKVTDQRAGKITENFLTLMDLRLGTTVYKGEGVAADFADPVTALALAESQAQAEIHETKTLSTVGSVLRQTADGELPTITRLQRSVTP